jgi:hypothetical protein
MNKLRNEFEEIFLDIEGPDTDENIVWGKKISYPRFESKKMRKEKKLETNAENLIEKNKEVSKLEVDDVQLDYLKSENLKKLHANELVDLKENVSLEILWIQQAIQSRIQVIVFQILFKLIKIFLI